MVNKTTAQKAVVAALSGMMALAPIMPAVADTAANPGVVKNRGPLSARGRNSVDYDGNEADRWERLSGDDRYATMAEIIDTQNVYHTLGTNAVAGTGLAVGTIDDDYMGSSLGWNGTGLFRMAEGLVDVAEFNKQFGTGGAINTVDSGWHYRILDTAIVVSGQNWADALTASSMSGFWRTVYTNKQVATTGITAFAETDGSKVTLSDGYLADLNNTFSDGSYINGRSDGVYFTRTSDPQLTSQAMGQPGSYNLQGWEVDYYAPIIITKSGSLSQEAKDALKNLQIENVIILGGEASVSDTVAKQIQALGIQSRNITRLAGADRVETSVLAFNEMIKLNRGFLSSGGNGLTWGEMNGRSTVDVVANYPFAANAMLRLPYYDVIIASGAKYADSLSVSPYATMANIPIILTDSEGNLTNSALTALKNSGAQRALIVGGTASVSASASDDLAKININVTRVGGVDRYETSWMIAEDLLQIRATGAFENAVVASGEVYADALVGAPFAAEFTAPIILVKDGASTLNYLEDNLAKDYWTAAKDGNNWILGGENTVSVAIKDQLEDFDGNNSRY